MDKKKKIIIAVAAAVVAVAITAVTIAFVVSDGDIKGIITGGEPASTKYNRVDYEPDEYNTEICANCEEEIAKGAKTYYPSDEFMNYLSQDLEKDEIAICERCAKEDIYRDEVAEGKSIEEYLRK